MSDWGIGFFVLVIGSIVGSFLNVCIYRIPKEESVVAPASHCPHCKRPIHWHDNIPVISFLILRGRCRLCRGRISPRYPIVEALTALLMGALFMAFGLSPKFFAYALLLSGLIIATFVDLEIQAIPDHVTFTGLIAGPILAFGFPSILGETSRWQSLLNSGSGIVAGGGSIFAIGFLGKIVFKKEAMGEGDIWLLAMIGSFIGWKLTILTFFIAPVFGSIVGVVLKYRYGRETIPYGPYLSLGALSSIFFGEKVLGYLLYGIR